jgi:hypothetical protein
MDTNTAITALLRCARNCVKEANLAQRRGEHWFAGELRASARQALAEIDTLTPAAPIDPETARKREIARAYAATMRHAMH